MTPPHTPTPDQGRAGEGFSTAAKAPTHLPYHTPLTPRARENRKTPTPAETLIWNKLLRGRQLATYKFLRQKPLLGYIVDFYCAKLKLAIEIDGHSHGEQTDYDAHRTRALEQHGITALRYTNADILQNLEGVASDLKSRINARDKTASPTPR